MATLWNPVPVPVFTQAGAFATGALAYFYADNTSTPITVYADPGLSTALPWPVVADASGVFQPIYLPYGSYRRRIVDQTGVLISDAGNIDNPAPPTSGGGIVVTSDMVLQTGDPIWRLRQGLMQGFVRMNENTIGSASSGASEYANAGAQSLFTYLWANLSDSIAPVITGRGASAAADWAANKQITIPTMKGLLASGVDDMGATAAGRIQAITTCTTNSTAVVTVASAANIAVGMNAIVGGAANGTVLSIVGTTITLSVAVPSSAAGVSFRASVFSDAQEIGALGGVATRTITSNQMPSHGHGVTDPGHVHLNPDAVNSFGYKHTSAGASAGGVSLVTSVTEGAMASATTGLTINNTGGGNPFSLLPPMRLGTYYMKL